MSENTNESRLADELREMGQQLKELIKATSEHPKTKEIEEKIIQAVRDFGEQIDRAVERAQTSEQGQRAKAAGTELGQTAHKWKESGARDDLERGLTKSVQVLSEQIRRAVEEIRKQAPKD